ncbi:uncharacterized protein LOC112084531 [Eutrema salsugineum]|uniref:uncharacterized protein LOC112084531 n=1 Tax=Eutrema salsugineum TaxID=72664 RepID=UPI000CED1B54|nr:uncharacterized protein LOC112084531 [Eutrema salsugineum]
MEKDIRELQNKLDKVLVATEKPIHFVGEFDEQGPSFDNVNEDGLRQEEINYIENQQRYQRFNNYGTNQNLSYRNPNVANPQDQPKQQFSGQQQSYGQQQQPAQGSNYNSQPQQHKFPPGFSPQSMGQQQQQQAPVQSQMGPDMCGLLQKLLQGQQRQKLIEDNEQIGGEAASRDEQEDEVLEKELVKDKAKEVEKEPELEKPYVPPRSYQPKIPFPERFKKKQILDRAKAVFEKNLENTQMTLPIIDTFLAIPQLGKFLKDAILNKTKVLQGMVILSHECSAIIQRRSVPRKLSDPGSFTLPCAIGPLKFSSCSCDLGASVSLMPYSVTKRLGFKSYKAAKISLVLADRSVRVPIGLLEDLPLRIGEIEIHTDFIVLEMDEEPIDPII